MEHRLRQRTCSRNIGPTCKKSAKRDRRRSSGDRRYGNTIGAHGPCVTGAGRSLVHAQPYRCKTGEVAWLGTGGRGLTGLDRHLWREWQFFCRAECIGNNHGPVLGKWTSWVGCVEYEGKEITSQSRSGWSSLASRKIVSKHSPRRVIALMGVGRECRFRGIDLHEEGQAVQTSSNDLVRLDCLGFAAGLSTHCADLAAPGSGRPVRPACAGNWNDAQGSVRGEGRRLEPGCRNSAANRCAYFEACEDDSGTVVSSRRSLRKPHSIARVRRQ